MTFEELVLGAAKVMEAAGVLVMIAGAAVSGVLVALQTPRERGGGRAWAARYTAYRTYLGRAILLGLEFLVAADIIRTVSTAPSLTGVAVLAVIVLIRTFLSFTLELEIDGRWPWERRA